MVDKIGGFNSVPLRRTEQARTEKSGGNAPTASASSAGQASATRNESLLARAERASAGAQEIDQAKVDEIKAAISRGEFKVDSRAVARAFMDLEAAG